MATTPGARKKFSTTCCGQGAIEEDASDPSICLRLSAEDYAIPPLVVDRGRGGWRATRRG